MVEEDAGAGEKVIGLSVGCDSPGRGSLSGGIGALGSEWCRFVGWHAAGIAKAFARPREKESRRPSIEAHGLQEVQGRGDNAVPGLLRPLKGGADRALAGEVIDFVGGNRREEFPHVVPVL